MFYLLTIKQARSTCTTLIDIRVLYLFCLLVVEAIDTLVGVVVEVTCLIATEVLWVR